MLNPMIEKFTGYVETLDRGDVFLEVDGKIGIIWVKEKEVENVVSKIENLGSKNLSVDKLERLRLDYSNVSKRIGVDESSVSEYRALGPVPVYKIGMAKSFLQEWEAVYETLINLDLVSG